VEELGDRPPPVRQRLAASMWSWGSKVTKVACAKGAVSRPDLGLSSAHRRVSTGGYDYQRLKFSGSHSAILALIQLFELWKSLTAFPGPTSSSRRSRS
jgi:hypothetical protein